MASIPVTRRAAVGTLAASTLPRMSSAQSEAVRWSGGTERPRAVAPPGATDRQFHTYDRRYPAMAGATLLPEYVSSKEGAPNYADAGAIAAAYVKTAPQRMVWGSDWPHPSEPKEPKPDDARLFDLFAEWAGEPAFNRILVDNPVELYDFPLVTP